MHRTCKRLLLPLVPLCFVQAPALAQTPHASERVVVSLTRDGLSLTTETSMRFPARGTEALTLTPESLRWRITSDGSWIAQAVSLGDHGALAFSEYGSLVNQTELFSSFDADVPAPVWSDGQVLSNFGRQVRSSESGGVHVAVHQEYSDSTQVFRHAVLRKYSSTSPGLADWSYTSPLLTLNEDHSATVISDDGQTIALLAYNGSTLDTQVTFFAPDSATPLLDIAVPTFGAFTAYDLSADGSTLALVSNLKLVVFDVASASVVHTAFMPGSPQFGALSLSGDGGLLAQGTLGEFSLLTRDAQGVYAQSYVHNLAMPTYTRRIELSDDGSTLVVGLNQQGNANDARILSIDVASQQVLIDTTLSGAGADLNLFETIECSEDGRRFAVGLWGDSDGLVPQVLVFRRDNFQPILADHVGGSVLALDLSADGTHLAVASKGTHAMQWGGGGSLSLYRVAYSELTVSGIPRSGAVIDLEHHLRQGTQGRMLVATSLADTPSEDLSVGSGLLYLDPSTMWELPITVAGAGDLASSPLALPSELSLVGSSYYVQALDVDNSELSRGWVRITILP